MVKVCDAIMGTGKSSAAIRFLNEHPNGKYIYITPYLSEAERIKKECPDLKFVEPNNIKGEYKHRKILHTEALIREGKNITSTHQAFKCYTPDMLALIREQEYVLLIDESVDVLQLFEFNKEDLQMAVDAGYVDVKDGIYTLAKPYNGSVMTDLFRLLESRELVHIEDEEDNTLYYWVLPPSLFTSFKDVYIMTYLFEGQSLKYFLDIYDIPYENIGIDLIRDGDGKVGYRFGEAPGYVPKYVTELKSKIHILENDKMNEVGDDYYDLSINWFNNQGNDVHALKKDLNNYFQNIFRDVPAEQRMWGCYKTAQNKVKGKGYTKNYVVFNTRATNNFKDKTHLAYPVNLFMNVNEKLFYQKHGIEVKEDIYALSVMVQWIWRSAIRDGHDIYLYIPSKRMRELLIKWIDKISGANEGEETS